MRCCVNHYCLHFILKRKRHSTASSITGGKRQCQSVVLTSNSEEIESKVLCLQCSLEETLENKPTLRRKRKADQITANSPETVQEVDGIFISDLSQSVGSYIKSKALQMYLNFSNCTIDQQTMISLGMNSILDLSYQYGRGQSFLFSQARWSELQGRFHQEEEEEDNDNELNDNMGSITAESLRVVNNLMTSKTSTNTKFIKLTNWLNGYKYKKNLNDDATFVLFLISHVLTLSQKQAYMFNDDVDSREWDIVLKIWSSLIELLFMDTNLRTKWGRYRIQIGQ